MAIRVVVAGAWMHWTPDPSSIEIAARVDSARSAIGALIAHAPDILVTNMELPEMTGLELAAIVQRNHPRTRVIIVATSVRSGNMQRVLDAGVRGYLLKDAPVEKLAEAVRAVHAGARAIAPELATEAWGEVDPLTDRERQVLNLAADGKSSSEIASTIHLAEGTVRNYLSEAISKLGASNRIDAARIARQKGWL